MTACQSSRAVLPKQPLWKHQYSSPGEVKLEGKQTPVKLNRRIRDKRAVDSGIIDAKTALRPDYLKSSCAQFVLLQSFRGRFQHNLQLTGHSGAYGN